MADARPARAQPDPGAAGAPWREPVRGAYGDMRYFALAGLEQMRAMLAGSVPRPPIGRLTGMQIVEAEDGAVAFRMPLSEWLLSPRGTISIGPLTIPADGALACSIVTKLPPATPLTTSELSLRLLAPVAPGGSITARGRFIQLRATIGLAEVAVTDDRDELIAHGSTLCFVQPPLSPAASDVPEPRADDEPREEATDAGAPDPYERPVRGSVLEQAIWDELSGLEVLEAQLAGELPLPPLHFLTGLTLSAADVDEVTFTMPASGWLCAPMRSRVQGGAIATLAEAAVSAAIQTRLGRGTAIAPIDLKMNYLRPLAADGRPAVARGRVQHAGRRIAVASAEVVDADGKLVALATGSAIVLPGDPASLRALEG